MPELQNCAALTHVRRDDFFLTLWLQHYGALVGRENCHVILDGDDWPCGVDLSGVQVTIAQGREAKRVRDDGRLADARMELAKALFASGIEYILHGDCDEFLVVDPAAGMTMQQALSEADEHGHLYVRGLDVIQDLNSEPDLDLSRPVMSQRRHGVIQKHFFKPSILKEAKPLGPGGHAVPGVVKVSSAVVMLHLANVDGGAMKARLAARLADTPNGTYDDHVAMRGALSDVMHLGVPPLDFDDAMAAAVKEFSTRGNKRQVMRPQQFKSGNITIPGGTLQAFYVTLPERLATTL